MQMVYEIVIRHNKYSRRDHNLVTDKTPSFLIVLFTAIQKGSTSVQESNK